MRAVNLIPAEQRSGASVGVGRSEGGAYAVLVLAVGLAVMALLYGSARREIASRSAQAASVAAKAQQATAEAASLAPYTSFIALREQRKQAVDTLVDSRFDWAHAFHEFGRVLPVQVSITSLSGTVGSATATSGAASSASSSSTPGSATPPGSVPTFTIGGCATSQSAVALTLERLRLIDGVSEVTLQNSTSSSTGGGGGSGGTCPPHDPTFTALITFDPLPSASSVAAATNTVSDATKSAGAR
jgi:Tfp pilus assembly protein PilN